MTQEYHYSLLKPEGDAFFKFDFSNSKSHLKGKEVVMVPEEMVASDHRLSVCPSVCLSAVCLVSDFFCLVLENPRSWQLIGSL